MAKDNDPLSFNFGANAVRKPAKPKGSGGRKPGKAKWAGKRGAAFRKAAFGS